MIIRGLLLWLALLITAKVNWPELEYISDELDERECFRLLFALRNENWIVNRTRLNEVMDNTINQS